MGNKSLWVLGGAVYRSDPTSAIQICTPNCDNCKLYGFYRSDNLTIFKAKNPCITPVLKIF